MRAKGIGHMKKLITVAATVLGLLTCSGYAQARLSAADLDLLRGVDGFRLAVDRIKPEIERDGLFRSTLLTDMELRLRMAGIKVLSEEEAEAKPDAPCLYLYVDALKCSLGYVYKIRLSLMEPVKLMRNDIKISATVLRLPDELGITPHLSEIRDAAGDFIDDFIKAWKLANSKK
jgi:hypothetical protein